jgi:hypothetical protein
MMKEKRSPECRLVGYVTPTSWDTRNNIKGISLITTDHEEIRIAHNKKGDRLLSLVWEKVEVMGRLENERGGRRRIVVNNYKTADFDSLAGDLNADDPNMIDDDLRDVFGNGTWTGSGDDLDLPRGL